MIQDPAKDIMAKLYLLNLKMNILEDGEYFWEIFNKEQWEGLKDSVVRICKELRPNAYALADLIHLPNSASGTLGNEDLDVYNWILSFVKS